MGVWGVEFGHRGHVSKWGVGVEGLGLMTHSGSALLSTATQQVSSRQTELVPGSKRFHFYPEHKMLIYDLLFDQF